MRAAIYARVSTGRQAQAELSMPDQVAQCERYCQGRSWTVAAVFQDAGYSATNDNRPDLQAMLAEAKAAHRPFDVVVVHSQSRFARSLPDLLFHQRDLERAKVSLVSITQDFGDGDAAPMMRAMIGIFDEHQSRETSKHVSRSMIENARQGFWNGAAPPFGYRTYVAEKRGKKDKKKLEVDEAEAAIVRRAFTLYTQGDGRSGPLGTKASVTRLDADGHRNRQGQDLHRPVPRQAAAERNLRRRALVQPPRQQDGGAAPAVRPDQAGRPAHRR